MQCLERTYEELKPVIQLPVISSQDIRLERTYEELKHRIRLLELPEKVQFRAYL